MCYIGDVKTYVHARLTREDRVRLDALKAATGQSESEIVRLGVKLAAEALAPARSAAELAGRSVGRFSTGPADLSVNRGHLDGFGE
jgi:hypothetical protein